MVSILGRCVLACLPSYFFHMENEEEGNFIERQRIYRLAVAA